MVAHPGGVERRLSSLRREERSVRLEEKFVVRNSGYHRTMERSLQEFGSEAERTVWEDLGPKLQFISGSQEKMPMNSELSQTQLLEDNPTRA